MPRRRMQSSKLNSRGEGGAMMYSLDGIDGEIYIQNIDFFAKGSIEYDSLA